LLERPQEKPSKERSLKTREGTKDRHKTGGKPAKRSEVNASKEPKQIGPVEENCEVKEALTLILLYRGVQRGLNTKRPTIVFFLDPTKPLP
jgi:hypothetical protein